ncbi:hypothetical protein FHV95_13269 [Streptomyces coelicolor]|nr:hypothetical protein FHV91_1364 [Streptomyces coelicolor]TYP02157.1 hypothetical protein FHV98_13637 [Streptomyces coelicolor A3(2)]TYP20646.1 hypothetical protein FHV92_1354 [Streptomyces coelicolor]TYP21697.1 hypothetical protein FHV94_13370 [Streptomyces coelicolor]TYP40602.1 hypothetical protein FHV95_13269 [Streptomyces coelicolor]
MPAPQRVIDSRQYLQRITHRGCAVGQRPEPGERLSQRGPQPGRALIAWVAIAGQPSQVRRHHRGRRLQTPVSPAHERARRLQDHPRPLRPVSTGSWAGGTVGEQAGAIGVPGEQLRHPRAHPPVGIPPQQPYRTGGQAGHVRIPVQHHQLGAHRCQTVYDVPSSGRRPPPARPPPAARNDRKRGYRRDVLELHRRRRLIPLQLRQPPGGRDERGLDSRTVAPCGSLLHPPAVLVPLHTQQPSPWRAAERRDPDPPPERVNGGRDTVPHRGQTGRSFSSCRSRCWPGNRVWR